MEGLIGEIRTFAGNYAPQNWLICNGSHLPVEDYQALYSLIGTTYGGDGRTSFDLPDLRGKMPVGKGQGPGLTSRQLGQTAGVPSVTLTTQTMPTHNHLVKTSSASSGNVESPSSSTSPGVLSSPVGTAYGYLKGTASGITKKNLNEKTIQDAGNGYPHNNLMPCMAINYIICCKGIYPEHK